MIFNKPVIGLVYVFYFLNFLMTIIGSSSMSFAIRRGLKIQIVKKSLGTPSLNYTKSIVLLNNTVAMA